jgi:hypothetical protein
VYGSPAGVVVFKNESGTGTLYSTGIDSLYCGYDDASNLFIDGDTAGAAFRLVELPNGSASTVDISTSPAINQIPGQVEWDGSYLTVEAGILSNREKPSIYRLSLSGSTATVEGKTDLKGIRKQAAASWIYDGVVISPYSKRSGGLPNIGYWKYPGGGRPTKRILDIVSKGTVFTSVTVSVPGSKNP